MQVNVVQSVDLLPSGLDHKSLSGKGSASVDDVEQCSDLQIEMIPMIPMLPSSSPKNSRVIAIDFDDVIACTNQALCAAHNAHYGTDITLDDFESYYVHRNRGWGSVAETTRKLDYFQHEMNVLTTTPPVQAVRMALLRLKEMGHPLHIVTARSQPSKAFVLDWLTRHDLEDVFTGVHFIGAFDFLSKTDDRGKDGSAPVGTAEDAMKEAFAKNAGKSSKVAVLKSIGAALLIDDHIGNIDKAAQAGIECLLFGNYRWNSRRWGLDTPEDALEYNARIEAGLDLPPAQVELLEGVARALSWLDAVKWVEEWDYRSSEPVA